MALTAEQKEANKEASLLKGAAHRARKNELDEALKKIDVTDLERATKEASEKFEQALETRNNECTELQRQISLLQDKIIQTRLSYEPQILAARDAKDKAYKKLFNERQQQTSAIEDRFPDLKGDARFYQGHWTPPDGYIEKFATDNAAELAKKKTKRTSRKP